MAAPSFNSGNPSGPYAALAVENCLATNSPTVALATDQYGASGTGLTIAAGASGFLGWLSTIWGALAFKDLTATASFPATIVTVSNWTSAALLSWSCTKITVGVTSTQAGALNIQRYMDASGTIAQGAVVSQAISANIAATVNILDGLPFQTFTVQVTNTSGSTATISNSCILLTH